MRPQGLVLSFFLIELALWPSNALALPACPGARFFLKAGETTDIEFTRKPGCDVRFMTVERGIVDRRLFYPSGKTDMRTLTVGQQDLAEAWSELPQKAQLRANTEAVVRFLGEAPRLPSEPASLSPDKPTVRDICGDERLALRRGENLFFRFGSQCRDRAPRINIIGEVEEQVVYPSGKRDQRVLRSGMTWSYPEWPRAIFWKARTPTQITFTAQAPAAPAKEEAPQEVCPGTTLQLSPGQEVSVRLGKRPGCNVGWTTYEGTVEEFITYPSGKTDRRTLSPTSGEFSYQETPSALRIKASTLASLKFLAQRPVPAQPQLPQLTPQVQEQRQVLQLDSEMISTEMAERLLALVVGAVVIILLMLLGKSSVLVIGHWSKLIENLQASPKEFYTSVEQGIERRQVPSISNSRVDWKEGGLFTAWREYLRISREKEVIDICGAPYGSAFFVSWWHGELQPSAIGPTLLAIGLVIILDTIFAQFGSPMRLIATVIGTILIFLFVGILINRSAGQNWVRYVLAIPVIGWLMDRLFLPPTYYRIDSASMFRAAIEQAVHEVVDQMAQAKGLRALTELEKKPILRDFFQRLR